MPIIQTWNSMPVMKRKVGGCVVNQVAKRLLRISGTISGTRSFQSNQEGTSLIGSLDPRDTTYWVHSCLQMAKPLKGKGLFETCRFAGRKGDMGLLGEKWVSERHRWLSNTKAERKLPSAPLIILQWATHITFHSEQSAVSNSRWWVSWWIEFLSVLGGGGGGACACGSDSLAATGSRLFLAGSLDLIDPAQCRRAPGTTAMSSRTSGLNKVISV